MTRKIFFYLLAFALLLVIWFCPVPAGVLPNGCKLLAVFIAMVLGLMFKVLPMGAVSLTALTFATLTKLISFNEAFSGFSNDVVWLILSAFFIARGFVVTGLGARLAYTIMGLLGKHVLGLGYGLVATDLLLAPAIPSVTARSGGIVFPVVKTLSQIFTGRSHDPKMGEFLTLTAFHGSVITSAMFLTAMAGNPLIGELARGQGIEVSWTQWMAAALVPGLVSLFCLPLVLYWLCTPTIRETPHAKEMAHNHLREMGKMKREEWIMLATFCFLIVFWIVGVKATLVALGGLVALLLTRVLSWKEVLEESGAWDTFVWFSAFISLSTMINKSGLVLAFSKWVGSYASGFEWVGGLLILLLVYFYAHYFFASNVAHISAMYTPFLAVAIAMGAPKMLSVLLLGFSSSLFGGLTQYGSGPAPIYFGAGFVPVATWWKVGFLVSVVNIAIWIIVGGAWWKLLGLW